MSCKRYLFVIVLVLLSTPGVAEDSNDEPPVEPTPLPPEWTIDVDNQFPFLGDPVIFTVESIYVREYVTLEVFRNGERVQQAYVRTNSTSPRKMIGLSPAASSRIHRGGFFGGTGLACLGCVPFLLFMPTRRTSFRAPETTPHTNSERLTGDPRFVILSQSHA